MALGVIIAAGIAGTFSILSLIIAKEHKVSEFRRSWLEDLRSELASFLSYANLFAVFYEQNTDEKTTQEFLESLKSEILGIGQSAALLRLRLRDDDAISKVLLEHIDALERLVNQMDSFDTESFKRHNDALIDGGRRLMRMEWQRVKEGEATFKTVKLVVLIAAFCLAGIFLYSSFV
jgi:uncharacterized protein YicC (UPF0701 family)